MSTAIDAERPCRAEGVLMQSAQGQTVLLRLSDGSYYALDPVGARIWELCDGARTVADIVATLAEEFDAPGPTIRADAVEFVTELSGEGLLTRSA